MNIAETRQPAVRIQGVHKSYRVDSVVTPVLRGVDIDVDADCLSVLAGPSGSGKTTLLNLIGCIDKPDCGTVTVLGQAVHVMADRELSAFRRENIGFVFQNFNLLPVLTAYENVEYPLHLAREGAASRRRLVRLALEQVGIAEHAHKFPNQLSGGQRQRVAIARALVKRPKLVLADEPTANLDSETGAAIIGLMKRLRAQHGIAFVVSSHDPQVHAEADHVFAIRDGVLLASPAVATRPAVLAA